MKWYKLWQHAFLIGPGRYYFRYKWMSNIYHWFIRQDIRIDKSDLIAWAWAFAIIIAGCWLWRIWPINITDLLLLYVLPGLVLTGLIIFIVNMNKFFNGLDDDD